MFTYYIMLYLVFNQVLVLAWEWGVDASLRRGIRQKISRMWGRDKTKPIELSRLQRAKEWFKNLFQKCDFVELDEERKRYSAEYCIDVLVSSGKVFHIPALKT